MRIAILSELFHPEVGGQSVRYHELGAHLVRAGHEVDVYTIRYDAALAAEEVVDGMRVHRAPLVSPYQKVPGPGRHAGGIFRYAWHVRRLLGERGSEFDLLLFNEWPIFHILLAPIRRRFRISVDWCEIRHDPVMRALQRAMARRGDVHVCVSDAVRDQLVRDYGVLPEKSLVLESGIYLDRYRRRDERWPIAPRIGFLGRIMAHKRVDLTIEAFRRLLARHPGATLRVVGDGPLLGQVRDANRDLVERGALVFEGFVDDATKVQILSECDLFVLTSEREGFPRVVAEAMASGVPVVTTNAPGNGTAAVVERYGCGLVTAHDADAVADALSGLASDRTRYEGLVRAGLQHAASLDWGTISGKLLNTVSR